MAFLIDLFGDDSILKNDLTIIWVGNNLCVQNYTKIIVYLKNKIVLKTKKGLLLILGKELRLKSLESGEVIIGGVIETISNNVNIMSEGGSRLNEI